MNKKYFLILIVFAAISAYAILYINALAVNYELSVPIPGETGTIAGEQGLPQYILMLFRFSLAIAGLLALGMIIFGAIQYTTSAGNVSGQQDAKDRITSAIYGLILLVGATLILTTINPDLALLKWEKPAPITGEQLSPATIKWGEAYRKIMADYQAHIKRLDEEKAKIELERKLAEADAAKTKEILDAAVKNPNISPKDILSLRIQNAEKIVAADGILVAKAEKDVDIVQTELNRQKLEVLNQLKKAIGRQISDKDTIAALQESLSDWGRSKDVSSPYATIRATLQRKAAISINIGGSNEIKLLMDEEDIKMLNNSTIAVFQWGDIRADKVKELNAAQIKLETSKNELQTLNSQGQPK